MTPRGGDTGSATVWVAALLLLIVSATLLAVGGATATGARHAAQLAADLAALAGAGRIGVAPADACAAAARVAAANGAVVDACAVAMTGARAGEVRVEVSRPARWAGFALAARARARAARLPGGGRPPPAPGLDAGRPAVWQHDPRGTAGVGRCPQVTALHRGVPP